MVDSGQLMLHDSATPPLLDGRYRVTVTPTAALAGGEAQPPAGTLDVEVGAPDGAAEVIAAHPVDKSSGGFADDLPFVVLRRRTMPWERAGFGQSGMPWLSVVVTRDSEAALSSTGTLRCTDVATQTRVLARPAEVRLLAHLREVNVADTVLAGGDDDGWQAVVVANRLPRAAGAWRATLVALDGRTDLLGGSPALGLSALFSWTFTVTGSGGGFGQTVAGLLPARYAEPAPGGPADPAGRLPLTGLDRSGRTSTVRYRPPLLPGWPAPEPEPEPAGAVEPDVTALSAFELGRLLAAADGRMLRELAQWRRSRLQATAAAGTSHLNAAALAPRALARWRGAGLPAADRFGIRGGGA
jgi:hypothetical protein